MHYGLAGNGRLWVLDVLQPQPLSIYDTPDALYDVAWSEVHENQLVTACGDGSLQLWDVTLPQHPIQMYKEHLQEVYSVHWNTWTPERPNALATFPGHTKCVYEAAWSPHDAHLFASVSGDCTLRLYDTRTNSCIQAIPGHTNEILSLDWNKYHPFHVYTASSDKSIKLWDLRRNESAQAQEVMAHRGHEWAVRRVRASPHSGTTVASASYDMSVRVWDMQKPPQRHDFHTEFVMGIDWNLFHPGELASCAWDERIHVSTFAI